MDTQTVSKRWKTATTPPAGWLTRKEVAQLAGINAQRVLQWEKVGKFPAGKMFGNVKVWSCKVIERYLETLEVEPVQTEGKEVAV